MYSDIQPDYHRSVFFVSLFVFSLGFFFYSHNISQVQAIHRLYFFLE